MAIIDDVFKLHNATWRGLGEIPQSGLKLRDKFLDFDIEKKMPLKIKHKIINIKQKKCRCPDILKGIIQPNGCPLFRKLCTPAKPYGPCMVSSEGACAAFHKYHQPQRREVAPHNGT